jgi:hypothetical protein
MTERQRQLAAYAQRRLEGSPWDQKACPAPDWCRRTHEDAVVGPGYCWYCGIIPAEIAEQLQNKPWGSRVGD